MALQCKTYCSSGALRAISMAKELLQGSNGCWRKEKIADEDRLNSCILQEQFKVSNDQVHTLATQFSKSDQKTFAVYTERTAFQRPLTGGVVYALKVLHADRERFEKQSGWTKKKMATEDQSLGRHDPSPVQDEYAPVVFSQRTVSHVVSLDMMSGKVSPNLEDCQIYVHVIRDAALKERIAATQGKEVSSSRLIQVLYVEKYLAAYFDISSLVKKLLHQLASKKTIVVNEYDKTNASAPINMYDPLIKETGLWHLSNLDFGDLFRKHEMHCRFNQKPPLPWSAITTSVVVFVFFVFFGHIFDRIAKVKDDCSERGEQKVLAEAADVAKSQWSIY
ncbi:hypothetical protein MRB53_030009 [Persea americana]|uniref:Uncharacterized protein n=1 Tax=Persea americana TaxID=3435 RepID=A0ACC2KK01_PERAE|nr:hypothetical protein MRB53_030009 [Persea americana]